MMGSAFRDNLLRVLSRKDLSSETIALVAEVVAIDARFNAAIAEKKRTDEDVDILGLAEIYESWIDGCVRDMGRFESIADENVFVSALLTARNALRRQVVILGGSLE